MHPIALLSLVVALAWAGSASAQSAPAAAASAPSDRAQRDADKVFRMILMHADKPRRAAARDDKAATTAPGASPAGRAVPPAPPARLTAETAAPLAKPAEPVAAAPAAVVPPAAAAAPVAEARPVETPTTATSAAPHAAVAASPVSAASPEPAVPKNTRLELIQSEEPVFPSRLVRQLGNGSVVVRFDVRPDGTVAQPEVVQSSHRGLNAAAVAAVSAWRFKPISETAPGIVELKFE